MPPTPLRRRRVSGSRRGSQTIATPAAFTGSARRASRSTTARPCSVTMPRSRSIRNATASRASSASATAPRAAPPTTATTTRATATTMSRIRPSDAPAPVSAVPPMNVLTPMGVGSATIGSRNRTSPPRARNPSRPTAISAGLSRMTNAAATRASRQPIGVATAILESTPTVPGTASTVTASTRVCRGHRPARVRAIERLQIGGHGDELTAKGWGQRAR